jgi:hypothetical protein
MGPVWFLLTSAVKSHEFESCVSLPSVARRNAATTRIHGVGVIEEKRV